MDKEEARSIVMAASQKAMHLFREDNPLTMPVTREYLDRQRNFINRYVHEHVPEDVQCAAV